MSVGSLHGLQPALSELSEQRHLASKTGGRRARNVATRRPRGRVPATASAIHRLYLYRTTDVDRVYARQPLRDLLPYLDAANIDLKSISDDVYHRLSGASLAPVQRTLRLIHEANIELEVTNLLVDGWNTSEEMVRGLCRWLVDNDMADVPLHLSRCFPSYRMPDLKPTPIPDMLRARDIAKEEGIRWVHLGNV